MHPAPDEHGRVVYQIQRDPTVTQEIDDIQLTFWIGSGIESSLRLELSTGVALELAATLTRAAGQAAASAARQLAIGQCDTCQNSRLVRVARHGREWSDRCPDCGPRYNEVGSGFPDFPRIGGTA